MEGKLLWMGLSVALALAGVGRTAGAQNRPGWKLVWQDEFDRPGLPDPAEWNYEVGRVRNHEAQYYTKARRENARVENGMLVIEARREPFEGADYTSASLTSRARAGGRTPRYPESPGLNAGARRAGSSRRRGH
jgi:hypothetical protein